MINLILALFETIFVYSLDFAILRLTTSSSKTLTKFSNYLKKCFCHDNFDYENIIISITKIAHFKDNAIVVAYLRHLFYS